MPSFSVKQLIVAVSIAYGSLQGAVLLGLSIYGYLFVKNSLLIGNKMTQTFDQNQLQSNDKSSNKIIDSDSTTSPSSPSSPSSQVQVTTNVTTPASPPSKKFVLSWIKIVWKLRSIYASFLVHTFDILTDIIVIIQWWFEETNGNETENVDTRLMAWGSIGIIIFHKTISSFAIWVNTRSFKIALLQFGDLLIFTEIYNAHKKVVSAHNSINHNNNNNNNDSHKKDDIDSTMTFKYIRSMEAIFESVPQAVLQLVYVMRTGELGGWIFGVSIAQSIISMTNSVLKDDNSRGMQGYKWKNHKKRFPPTTEFLSHGLSRLSQVISRIFILAIFWTVVGGLGFSILLGCEILIAMVLAVFSAKEMDTSSLNLTDSLLFLSSIVIISPELVFVELEFNWYDYVVPCLAHDGNWFYTLVLCLFSYPLCGCVGSILSQIVSCNHEMVYFWPNIRLGLSFIEIILIIIYGIIDYENEDKSNNYLFWEWNHCLLFFIICIISYIIDCAYLRLFPNFKLPKGINARSKWGLAFAGELTELEKLNNNIRIREWQIDEFRKANLGKMPNDDDKKTIFWDEQNGAAPIDFALANKQFEIVNWLQQQGASKSQYDSVSTARQQIDSEYEGWTEAQSQGEGK